MLYIISRCVLFLSSVCGHVVFCFVGVLWFVACCLCCECCIICCGDCSTMLCFFPCAVCVVLFVVVCFLLRDLFPLTADVRIV